MNNIEEDLKYQLELAHTAGEVSERKFIVKKLKEKAGEFFENKRDEFAFALRYIITEVETEGRENEIRLKELIEKEKNG